MSPAFNVRADGGGRIERTVNQSPAYIYNSLTAESSEYASCLVKYSVLSSELACIQHRELYLHACSTIESCRRVIINESKLSKVCN
jgi:hypothetical protein